MSKFIYDNVALWAAEYDLSGETNQASLSASVPEKNCTVFNSGDWEAYVGGIPSATVGYEGYLDHAGADLEANANLGTAAVVSFVPNPSSTPALGDISYLFKAPRFGTNIDFQFNELAAGSVTGRVDGPVVRGQLMVPKAAITSSATTSSSQVGAVTATQKVYAALHVFTVSGTTPTLDVTVRSDDNSGMTSPTTRLTFTQATAATSEWQSLAGAVTDDYWDVDYTIAGTSPSFTFAVTLGIQ